MITLKNYILTEAKLSSDDFSEMLTGMFRNASKDLTKDAVKNMLSFLWDNKMLVKYSDYLAQAYTKEYVAFQPNSDEFINDSNKDKVITQIAEFVNKHIN